MLTTSTPRIPGIPDTVPKLASFLPAQPPATFTEPTASDKDQASVAKCYFNVNEFAAYAKKLLEKSTGPNALPLSEAEKRITVLADTVLDFIENGETITQQAELNHQEWGKKLLTHNGKVVAVIEGDWGDVALAETIQFGGVVYTVLNMANAFGPGGGYLHGAGAQEENMFRRTNCALSARDHELEPTNSAAYSTEMTKLIESESGSVYLDLTPRICFKGSEANEYKKLDPSHYFLFREMRSAAIDFSRGKNSGYTKAEIEQKTRTRIASQLDTLIKNGQKHVILSAFGCGAFKNDPKLVARLYKEELEKRRGLFERVVFAIFTDKVKINDPNTDSSLKKYLQESERNLACFKEVLADVQTKYQPARVTKTASCIYFSFASEHEAECFAIQHKIPQIYDKNLHEKLPLVDKERLPGLFLVRLLIENKDPKAPISSYKSFQQENPHLKFLDELQQIPVEGGQFTDYNQVRKLSAKEKFLKPLLMTLQNQFNVSASNISVVKKSIFGEKIMVIEFTSPTEAHKALQSFKKDGYVNVSTGTSSNSNKVTFTNQEEWAKFLFQYSGLTEKDYSILYS